MEHSNERGLFTQFGVSKCCRIIASCGGSLVASFARFCFLYEQVVCGCSLTVRIVVGRCDKRERYGSFFCRVVLGVSGGATEGTRQCLVFFRVGFQVVGMGRCEGSYPVKEDLCVLLCFYLGWFSFVNVGFCMGDEEEDCVEGVHFKSDRLRLRFDQVGRARRSLS